jgi:hypothetical protein
VCVPETAVTSLRWKLSSLTFAFPLETIRPDGIIALFENRGSGRKKE